MSESKTLNNLTAWSFKAACDIIKKEIEQGNIDQAIDKCDQEIQEATDLKNITWVNKFKSIKQEIINLKQKEKNMDSTKHKITVPRLEEKKEVLKTQDTEIIEILDTPEQEESLKDELSLIKGVGSTTKSMLIEAGIVSVNQLATMTPDALAQVKGFGLGSSEHIINAAKELLERRKSGVKKKRNTHTPMFDPKFRIDRASKSIPPAKKAHDLSDSVAESQREIEDDLEELEEQTDSPSEIYTADTPDIIEKEKFDEVLPSAELNESSEEDELNIIANEVKTHTENNRYQSLSREEPQESKSMKNEVISGFLNDALEIPQKNTSEIRYEEVMQEIKNDFSADERLNKKDVTSLLKQAQEVLQSFHYYNIPKTWKIFNLFSHKFENKNHSLKNPRKPQHEAIDFIALKVLSGNNDTDLILISPIKICDLKGTLLVSDNGLKYHSEQNPKLQENLKGLLLKPIVKDFKNIQSVFFDNMAQDEKIFRFFRKYLKDSNISIEKGRNNHALFFRSGLKQYKILIEPILLCNSLPSSLEKSVLFPYQKSTNIHYINYEGLSSLIPFIEHKYQALESHCIERNAVKIYFDAKLRFINNLRNYSIPFVSLGLLFFLIIILQGDFLINTFIGLGAAAICAYGVILACLYMKFAKTKTDISKEFSTPYHLGKIRIDDTELLMISKDFSSEQMDQFIYECFGKKADFPIMSKIEEDKYIHTIVDQKQGYNSGKNPLDRSIMEKSTHSKYGPFLED